MPVDNPDRIRYIVHDMKRGEHTWTLADYRDTVDRLLELLDPDFLERRGRFVSDEDFQPPTERMA